MSDPVILSEPLVYDDTIPTSSIQRVLFVSSGAASLETYANATTFTIVYGSTSSLEDIWEVMRRKFSGESVLVSRIGFAFHNHGDLTEFCNRETWFSDSDVEEEGQTVFSRNVQFMFDLLREFKQVTHVDFLACKTLQSEKWRKYFSLLQAQTGVVVGASEDDTGNVKYGGDWVLESTMEDIREVYFTGGIENYANLLAYGDMASNYGQVRTVYNANLVLDGDNKLYALDEGKYKQYEIYNTSTYVHQFRVVNTDIALQGADNNFLLYHNGVLYYSGTRIVQTGPIYSENYPGGYYYNNVYYNCIGKRQLSNGTNTPVWIPDFGNKNEMPLGAFGFGNYLYVHTTYNKLYKIPTDFTGSVFPADTPFLTITIHTGKMCSDGTFLFVVSATNCIQIKLSDFSIVTSSFLNPTTLIGNLSSIAYYNNVLYVGKTGSSSNYRGQVDSYSSITGTRISQNIASPVSNGYQNTNPRVIDMCVYTDPLGRIKLLCITESSQTLNDVDISPGSPFISIKPTAIAAITYPAKIGSIFLTGGTARTASSGTTQLVLGTFIIRSDISNNIINAGTYTDISATFLPTDTSKWQSASTFVQSVTINKGTPFISVYPTATIMYPNKLRNTTFSGGECLETSGGLSLAGTFTIHPDLSNSVFPAVGTYDVSAVFTPTSSGNYGTAVTRIPLTVTIGTPVITVRPDATVVYPNRLDTALFSGGATLDMSGGSALLGGTYSIHPDFSNSVIAYNGSFSDISAVYNPPNLTNFKTVTTKLRTLTVFQGTPFISARPTATVTYPNKLGSVVFNNDGVCLDSDGGSIDITGIFTIHPDLSNSLFPARSYQDVSAIFTPSASFANYGPVSTTIQTLTITEIDISLLKSLDLSVDYLRSIGYSSTRLKTAGYTAAELKLGGYSNSDIKTANYNASALKEASYNATTLKNEGYTADELKTAYNASELKSGGFGAAQLKAAQYSAADLKAALFSASELKTALFSATELKTALFSAGELKTGGYSATELKTAQYSATELKTVLFSATELKTALFTAGELKTALFTATELKTALFSTTDLKTGGYSAAELKTALFSATELKTAQFSATDLKTAQFSATDLKTAQFSATELKTALFTATELKTAQFTATELKTAQISATELKTALFTATDLKTAQFSAADLKTALFTATDLKTAQFSATDLKTAQFSASDLKTALFSATELKAAQFSAGELKAAQFSATDLKTGGFSATDLKTAQFSANELKSAQFSASDLKTALFTATDLKTAQFSADELKAAQFSATDLKTALFTAADLKTAQFSATELKTALFSAAQLKTALFSATDLKAANYTLENLKDAGYDAVALKAALYQATELLNAGFALSALSSAGYEGELKAAGKKPSDLVNAGFAVDKLYTVFSANIDETKSVTKAFVSNLLPATAGKTNVTLSQLRGYAFTPAVNSVVAVKVTNPVIPVTVERDELSNGSAAVYAILDVPDCYMVLPTWSSSVQVMNAGNDTYEIYDSDGTTILHDNLVSGDTITEDGLTVVIGSVTATLAPIVPVSNTPVRHPFFINSYTNGGGFSMNRTLYTKTLQTVVDKEGTANKQFYGKNNRDASSVIHRRKLLNLGRTPNTMTKNIVEKVETNDVRQAKQRVRNSGYVVPPSQSL